MNSIRKNKKNMARIAILVIILLFGMRVVSNAVVVSTDKTVESGSTVTISVSARQALGSYNLKLTSEGGLTLVSASGGEVSSDNRTITNSSSSGMTNLGSFTFKVPEVSEQKKYSVTFSITAMSTTDLTDLPNETNTAVVTVNPKQTTPPPAENTTGGNQGSNTPEPTVTYKDVNQTMYATGSINVRSGPGTSYDKKGSLSKDQEVTVTGIGSNGWNRVKFNGSTAYISANLLTSTKPDKKEEDPPVNNTVTNEQTNTAVNNEVTNTDTNIVTNEIAGTSQTQEGEFLQLKSLTIKGIDTSTIFKPSIYEYQINVAKGVKKLEIEAKANQEGATVEILGNEDFKEGENTITIILKSENGEETVTYQLLVNVGATVVAETGNSWIIYAIIAVIVIIVIAIVILIIRNRRNRDLYEEEDEMLDENENDISLDEGLFNKTTQFEEENDFDDNGDEKPRKRGKHF